MTRILSEAGRAACSLAGHRSLVALQEGRDNSVSGVRDASKAFEARLREDLGEKLSAVHEALVMAGVASYCACFLLQRRLKSARSFKRVLALSEALPGVTSNLLRVLRALGLESGPDSDNDEPTRGGVADYLARKEREAANVVPRA